METPSTSQVRAWARERGVAVGDRGRLPADLVAQYLAAQRGTSRAAEPAGASAPSSRLVIGRTVTAKQRWDWNR